MVSDPPVIRRIRAVMTTLQNFIEQSDESGFMVRMTPFMTTMVEEIAEELSEKDEATMQVFMAQIGEVISWIGHGDNERLPEQLRTFAEAVQPSPGGTSATETTPQPETGVPPLELTSQKL